MSWVCPDAHVIEKLDVPTRAMWVSLISINSINGHLSHCLLFQITVWLELEDGRVPVRAAVLPRRRDLCGGRDGARPDHRVWLSRQDPRGLGPPGKL